MQPIPIRTTRGRDVRRYPSRDPGPLDALLDPQGVVKAVDGLDLTLRRNHTMCVVGESGSGKSMTASSILQILKTRPDRRRRDPLPLPRRPHGRPRQARPQQQADAGDPRQGHLDDLPGTDDLAVARPHDRQPDHRDDPPATADVAKAEARERTIELLAASASPSRRRAIDPIRSSSPGGMRQRVMIAMALSCEPEPADRRRADHGARRDDAGATSST